MKVIFTDQASEAVDSIYKFTVSLVNEKKAKEILFIIEKTINVIETFPDIGKVSDGKNTKELMLDKIPYNIIYKIEKNTIYILGIMHTSRNNSANYSYIF